MPKLVSKADTVHPRMRGEHAQVQIGGGTVRRFIPACAGNTLVLTLTARLAAVHPRMRGEHRMGAERLRGGCGSSPHARGTLACIDGRSRFERFIPACAGNTVAPHALHLFLAVHPRMRGEHPDRLPHTYSWPGSSPHARGTLLTQAFDSKRKKMLRQILPN